MKSAAVNPFLEEWGVFLRALHNLCVSSTGNDLVLTVVLCLCMKIIHVSKAIKSTL